jgi:transcription initiation factor TFIIE subunit alpha
MIDWRQLIDGTKWRLMRIRQTIQQSLKKETEIRGYVCPRCERRFDTLEATRYIHPVSMLFLCEFCNVELFENDNVGVVQKIESDLATFSEQMQPVMMLLQATDGIQVPIVTEEMVAQAVASQAMTGPDQTLNDMIPFAQDNEQVTSTVTFEIATNKREEDSEALMRKRAQNLKPVWVTQSTVDVDYSKQVQRREEKVVEKSTATFDYDSYYNGLMQQQQQPSVRMQVEVGDFADEEDDFEAVQPLKRPREDDDDEFEEV